MRYSVPLILLLFPRHIGQLAFAFRQNVESIATKQQQSVRFSSLFVDSFAFLQKKERRRAIYTKYRMDGYCLGLPYSSCVMYPDIPGTGTMHHGSRTQKKGLHKVNK